MRVRATLRLRNDHLIAAREKLGLSQIKAAELSEISLRDYACLEMMRYDIAFLEDKAAKVAKALEVPVEQVAPPGLVDAALTTSFVAIRDISEKHLINRATSVAYLPAPEEAASGKEFVDAIKKMACGLPERESMVLTMKYGLDGKGERSYEQIAKQMGVVHTRVRQIEAQAIRRCQKQTGKAYKMAKMVRMARTGDMETPL